MKRGLVFATLLLAGCASSGPLPDQRPAAQPDAGPGPVAIAAPVPAAAGSCTAEVARLSALLAAETAERQRLARNAARREEALRRQLDAMKAIERGILEREDRMRTEAR